MRSGEPPRRRSRRQHLDDLSLMLTLAGISFTGFELECWKLRHRWRGRCLQHWSDAFSPPPLRGRIEEGVLTLHKGGTDSERRPTPHISQIVEAYRFLTPRLRGICRQGNTLVSAPEGACERKEPQRPRNPGFALKGDDCTGGVGHCWRCSGSDR